MNKLDSNQSHSEGDTTVPHYERLGPHILDHTGHTIDTTIRLPGNSEIEIKGDQPYTSFLLKFSNEDRGWWVHEEALGCLIAELLYIQRELVEYRHGEEQVEDVEPEF